MSSLCAGKSVGMVRYLTIVLLLLGGINSFAGINDGYMNKMSYEQGDSARVFVNATAADTNKTIYLYNVNHVLVDSVVATIGPQSINTSSPWENGYGYAVSFTYVIPVNLASGIYNWEDKIFFIIKSPTKNADITVVYPSNTEQAYNSAGGKSLYTYPLTSRPHAVSFLRPLDYNTLAQVKVLSNGFMKWAQKLTGYSIQYICDMDMDDSLETQNSKILMVVGHSEYWTRPARLNFDKFVDSGKDALILSGNTMWWQVRYNGDKNKLVCYKISPDTISDPLLKTVNWPDTSLHYPLLTSIGVDYNYGCYPQTWDAWFGFKIMQPTSPIFAGTGLSFGNVLSCKSFEADGTLIAGFDSLGHPIIDSAALGFCKIELLGYDSGQTSIGVVHKRAFTTFIAFQKTPISGRVINVSSTNWCADNPPSYPGGFGGPDSLKIQTITKNMMDIFLAHGNIFSNPITPCMQTTGVANLNEGEFELYPNPSNGKFKIRMGNMAVAQKAVVYDMMGKKHAQGFMNEEFDLAFLPNGVYFVNVGSMTKKLIINH